MNKRWLLGSVLCSVMSFAHAEGSALPEEMTASDVQPISAEVNPSLTVVGYSDSSRQIGDNSLSPVEPAMGVQVDYQPFHGGFNVSAANFQTPPDSSLNNTPHINRTYLGVGWKKLLDDAQNLGVRVDIGAVYDDKISQSGKEMNNTVIPSHQNSDSDTTWQPVISLGVSYRF